MAVWAGIAGGAQAYGEQQKQQQADARWQQRYEMMQANEQNQEQARQRYIAALNPPKTDSLHTTDEGGQPIVQAREWVPPSDADITAGKSGSFRVTGSTPDINFEKLDQKREADQQKLEMAQKRLDMQGQLNAARMEAAAAKSGAGREGFSFADYAKAQPDQRALYDRYRRGEDDPAVKAKQVADEANRKADFEARKNARKDLENSPNANPTAGERSTALYENQVAMNVDPFATVKQGVGTSAPPQKPMGQFSGPGAASKAPPEGTIVRGKDGRRYVVRNGKPVPL